VKIAAPAIAVALVGIGCTDDGGPGLASATPAAAVRGATVTLAGSRLCGQTGDCAGAGGEVDLGVGLPEVRAPVTAYAETSIDIVIPALAPVGATKLVLTVNEQASNALAFEVLP
jgi:hypothetical protein